MPVPFSVTFSVALNVAVTLSAALIVTTHVPVPLHTPPDQLVKLDPEEADAVKVTVLPLLNTDEHWLLVGLQVIPAGLLVTRPAPLPLSVTLSAKVISVKVAVTLSAALIVVTQELVPPQPPPDQPAKVELAFGVAVSVTCVPC